MINSAILNPFYRNLPDSYLFSAIAEKVAAYKKANPDADIVRLGIGDVTNPLVPSVIEAMHKAVDEMGSKSTFRGYGPEQGYEFLREAVIRGEYTPRNIELSADEVFISDGSKCDVGNIQELFNNKCLIAIPDPVYPVYLDSNIMAGRDNIVFMPAVAENDFQPEVPQNHVDVIYLCSPNNPTGTVLTKKTLEKFVDYARNNGAVILFDAAYSAYIRDDEQIHSIYEIAGAKECAIEFKSFSKTAGFTGVRCAVTVIPHEMEALRAMWFRRQSTKFNGVNYIVQRGAEAVYSETGWQEITQVIDSYMATAAKIRSTLAGCGFTVFGGENAPYIWWQLKGWKKSFDFFDRLLEVCQVVGTPGSGFGSCGEGYFRLTSFGDPERTEVALERIKNNLSSLF